MTNVGTAPGTATTPVCAAPPVLHIPVRDGTVCAQGGPDVTVLAGATITWSIGFSATSDATVTGTPLAPGTYTVTIGGAQLTLDVS